MIDFQGLLAILDAAEKEPNIKMDNWKYVTECGTSHCMIGAFCNQNPQDRFQLREEESIARLNSICYTTNENLIAERFGITMYEARWLFMYNPILAFTKKTKNPLGMTKEEALTRLRKFIYYKLHKQEMTLEEGRQVSGNEAVIHSMELVK